MGLEANLSATPRSPRAFFLFLLVHFLAELRRWLAVDRLERFQGAQGRGVALGAEMGLRSEARHLCHPMGLPSPQRLSSLAASADSISRRRAQASSQLW